MSTCGSEQYVLHRYSQKAEHTKNHHNERMYDRIMKKLVSLVMSICILLAIVPVSGFTETAEISDHYKLIDLADEVFPEYSELIHSTPSAASNYSRGKDDTIVHYETRQVTNDESLTLVEYESGNILLLNARNTGFSVEENKSDPTYEGAYKYGSVDYTVTSTVALGVFYLKNVCYAISMNRTGRFTSYGTPSVNNSSDMHYSNMGNDSVTIKYFLTFNWNAAKKTYADFRVSISNGVVSGYIQD